MKHLFYIITYLFLQLFVIENSYSQKVNWGPQYTWDQKNHFVSMKEYIARDVVGWDNTGFYFLFEENQSDIGVMLTPIIEKFDYNLNKIYSQRLPKEIISVHLVRQTPVLFSLVTDYENKIDYLSIETLDKEGNLLPKKTLIDIQEKKSSLTYDWAARLSGDSSKLGIFTYCYNKAKDGAVVKYMVMDDKLTMLSEHSFTIQYNFFDISFENFCIDNNNNIHILMSMTKGKPLYKLISYFPTDKKTTEIEIIPESGYINNPSIMIPKRGMPFVCGFVTESDNNRAKGFFIKKMAGSSAETTKLNYFAFDQKLYADLFPSKNLDKDLFINDLIETGDNSYLLLAEQFNPEFQTARLDRKTRVGSILAIKTDTTGNLKWWRGIYKVQDKLIHNYTSSIQGWALARKNYDEFIDKDHLPWYSYTYAIKGANVMIMYADNIKNKTKTTVNEIKTLDEKDDCVEVQLTLSPDGSFKKELYDPESKYFFRTRLSFYSQQAGLITHAHFRSKGDLVYQFGKVGFK